MSREVRRVPLGWQHPTEWREQWDRAEGGVRMQCLPRPLFGQASDGRVFVSMVIDYGQHGTTFCDGAHLKSAAGIVKRAAKFLGEPKAA